VDGRLKPFHIFGVILAKDGYRSLHLLSINIHFTHF